MRNQRNNFIPVPTKPAKTAPKPLPRVLAQRKSSSSQTERVVLIKEENLTFYPCARFGQNDGGMRRDYAKAVNYINSCHKFMNTIIEKNADTKSSMFQLPMVTNFIPIFSFLLGKKPPKPREKPVEKAPKAPERKSRTEERKSKSSFAVKKGPAEGPADPLPVGDCPKSALEGQEERYANQVADIVREQIQQFLNNLHEDMDKATKKRKSDPPKQKCKNLDIVKQRLEELSKICFLQKNMENQPTVVELVETPKPAVVPPTPPPINTPEDCSVIQSDTEEEAKKSEPHSLRITCYDESASSLGSETSDIKSDSDLEIIN